MKVKKRWAVTQNRGSLFNIKMTTFRIGSLSCYDQISICFVTGINHVTGIAWLWSIKFHFFLLLYMYSPPQHLPYASLFSYFDPLWLDKSSWLFLRPKRTTCNCGNLSSSLICIRTDVLFSTVKWGKENDVCLF